jgi:hypothetical protein
MCRVFSHLQAQLQQILQIARVVIEGPLDAVSAAANSSAASTGSTPEGAAPQRREELRWPLLHHPVDGAQQPSTTSRCPGSRGSDHTERSTGTSCGQDTCAYRTASPDVRRTPSAVRAR